MRADTQLARSQAQDRAGVLDRTRPVALPVRWQPPAQETVADEVTSGYFYGLTGTLGAGGVESPRATAMSAERVRPSRTWCQMAHAYRGGLLSGADDTDGAEPCLA